MHGSLLGHHWLGRSPIVVNLTDIMWLLMLANLGSWMGQAGVLFTHDPLSPGSGLCWTARECLQNAALQLFHYMNLTTGDLIPQLMLQCGTLLSSLCF